MAGSHLFDAQGFKALYASLDFRRGFAHQVKSAHYQIDFLPQVLAGFSYHIDNPRVGAACNDHKAFACFQNERLFFDGGAHLTCRVKPVGKLHRSIDGRNAGSQALDLLLEGLRKRSGKVDFNFRILSQKLLQAAGMIAMQVGHKHAVD